MAWAKKICGKKGVYYQIKVSDGIAMDGKQKVHTKVWRPEPGMTERQIEKALEKEKYEYEMAIRSGYQLDNRHTFAEYAEYVIRTKEQAGVKRRTIARYEALAVRTNAAIGHKKLAEIRPAHLNLFYKNLAEEGVRENGERYVLIMDLAEWMRQPKMTKTDFSHRARIGTATLNAVLDGKKVNLNTAKKVAEVVELPLNKVFEKCVDTTPLAPKTILEYHRFISTVFSMAVKEMLLPYNPASRATPPKQKKQSPDYYQPEELDRILDALEDVPVKWKTITYLLIDTGCRRGEIAGLKWSDVDLETGIVMIDHALLYSPKDGTYEDTTKSERERGLSLAPETIELLKLQKAEQERMKAVLGSRWTESDYIFTKEMGGPMNPDSITQWLNNFSKKYNLPHIHPHAFRHTAASMMIAEGVDIVTASNELGHANPTITANIYAHQIALAKAKASSVRSSAFRSRKSKEEPDGESRD